MMQPNNSLAVILPEEWQVLTQQANALVNSGFLPESVNTPQKAVAIMTLGRELGIGAWAALTSINVIQRKPTISPQLMLALINRSGQLEDMKVQDEGGTVHVMMKRKGRTEHWESFGQADAEKMNLWNKPNWKSQPVTMMKWRAVAACARVVFPDVILGLYTPEEMGANVVADEQGNMTIVEVKRESSPQLPEGDVVEASQSSASVSGAGIPKVEPVIDLGPLGDEDDLPPPNLYLCTRLRVNVSRTATQFILMTDSGINIFVPPVVLEDKQVNGKFVQALGQGVYPLDPPWKVTAELDNGAWRVDSVETDVPEGEAI